VRSVAGRYLVGAFAFMAAATWLGVGLTSGFACLAVFLLASQAVRVYQQRSGSDSRRAGSRQERPSRERPSRSKRASAEERDVSIPAAPRIERPRPSGRVYDGDYEQLGWPVASDATW
jgi:hypothetical protein